MRTARLRDGDLIQMGRNFYLYRDGHAFGAADPPVVQVGGSDDATFGSLIPRLRDEFASLVQLARARVPVALIGEMGVGKRTLARALHREIHGSRPLIEVECTAISARWADAPGDEARLAVERDRRFLALDDRDRIRGARDGTVVLSEIHELSLRAQTALLDVIDGLRPRSANDNDDAGASLIVTAIRGLGALVRDDVLLDRFRARVGFEFAIPPVRERVEDIGIFIARAIRTLAPATASSVAFSPEAACAILGRAWRANLHGLHACLESALARSRDGWIRPDDLRTAEFRPVRTRPERMGPARSRR